MAAFRGMYVSPAKHRYAWLQRKFDRRTDDGQSDPYMPLCFESDTITCSGLVLFRIISVTGTLYERHILQILEFFFKHPCTGFHRTYATGAACQQRTLTPPDTWSCPTLGLACFLMSRPISPELVLSPDFWISNSPRYFSFA